MADHAAGPRVAVVGAGIAGLAAAWELAEGGARVVVLESEGRVGGRLAATELAGRVVDLAADAFLARRPEGVEFARELGLEDELVPVGASGASVFARGRLRRLPTALNLGVPTRWLPLARSGILSRRESLAVAVALARPHRRPPPMFGDRSVAAIVESRLGRPTVERLVDPLVGGIHAGSADDLSAAALFPLLIAADQQPGNLMRNLRRAQPPADPSAPVFVSLRGSTASLADAAARALEDRGVAIRRRVHVEGLEPRSPGNPAVRWSLVTRREPSTNGRHPLPNEDDLDVDGVVLAVPAPAAALLLDAVVPAAARQLGSVEHASVATITVALPSGTLGNRGGTGFLVPRTTRLGDRPALVTAVTYLDRKWPHLGRNEDELVRMSVGRHGDARHEGLDDEDLVSESVADLSRLLGTSAAPDVGDAIVARWPAAFPQYSVGHLLRMRGVLAAADSVGGLGLAGSAYRGVGIPACIASGRAAARVVLDHLFARGTAPAAGTSGADR